MSSRLHNGFLFNLIHNNNLVYNTCWEDPRLDRRALDLSPDDIMLVITSAGCNTLDYALMGPRHIYAVDINPRQNALLELKLAGIRYLDFETFFAMFGRGTLPHYQDVYHSALRATLSPTAQAYWDRNIVYFSGQGWQRTFYFHGTSGIVAHLANVYADHVVRVRDVLEALLHAGSLEEQRDIYYRSLREAFWTRFMRWMVGRNQMLSMVGVPRAQRQQVERHYAGGIARFIEDCVETVFAHLPLRDNYFWRVYMSGSYTPECCPEYLKKDNFAKLQAGLIDGVSVHTGSILHFLRSHHVTISRFVLLDHMDWLSTVGVPILQAEWQAMLDHAAPASRFLWRSGGLYVDYVDPLRVTVQGRQTRMGHVLTYHKKLATALHAQDRVHTYGSFYIADLVAA